jgi:hypothetical protein
MDVADEVKEELCKMEVEEIRFADELACLAGSEAYNPALNWGRTKTRPLAENLIVVVGWLDKGQLGER